MSYEHRAHVLVLGSSLSRAVDKMNELVGGQEITATMTQKSIHTIETTTGITYRAKTFGASCQGLRADVLYIDKNATTKDSDDFQDIAEPIPQLVFMHYLLPGFDTIIWF